MNVAINDYQVGTVKVDNVYEVTVKNVATILEQEYHMSPMLARRAIVISPLKTVFDKDPDMAAHTATEVWAKEVYRYWIQRRRKQRIKR